MIVLMVISHILCSILTLVIYIAKENKFFSLKPNKNDSTNISTLFNNDVVAQDNTDNIIYMNEDEYIKYLKKKYPKAVKDYNEYIKNRELFPRMERHIIRLLISLSNKEITAVVTKHTINFSTGDRIWIANKYYSYGNLYESKTHPHCAIEKAGLCINTFLRIVDLEETLSDPLKNNKNIKVIYE